LNPAEAYILKQNEPFKSILLELQAIIYAVIPDVEMLYKWRIPVFYVNGIPICYLNKSKDYVDFAFWHKENLNKYQELLVTSNRKSVASLRYKFSDEIDGEVIVYVLNEQLRINTSPYKMIRKTKT